MRNLLGRLHARGDGELRRIAAFWWVPLSGSNRHASVGALYRAITDIRTVRDAWDRLTPEQQEAVRVLAVVDDAQAAPTLPELAEWLGVEAPAVREIAVQLYHIGLLAREGDDQPLPVGAEPKLFLPRELALLFRRLLDDIDAGDLSAIPLPVLLDRLDDAEIETAASRWGLRVVPGTRDRDDLGRRLLQQVGTPGAVDRVTGKLSGDAARVLRTVWDATDGAPLDTVAASLGVSGDEPRTMRRWWAALDDVEAALLVWHTYRADGARLLFVPTEIRDPKPSAPAALPPLRPVLPPEEGEGSQSVQNGFAHALAWDFLTLLRELADPELPAWPATGERPRSRLRRLNQRCWIRGRDLPPAGYVECLLALGQAEGLLHVDESELRLTPAMRGWRERSFPAQTERLRWWWMASAQWIEGQARGELELRGVDWPAARRSLVAALTDPAVGLELGTWYEVGSVTERIAAHRPGLLGPSFTVASAKRSAGPADDPAARLATIVDVIAIELETMLAWLGIVQLRSAPGQPRSVRVLPSVVDQDDAQVSERDGAVPPLTVLPNGAIELRDPIPLRVWSLSAFADLELLGQPSLYRLSAASIRRALAAGFDLDQVTSFLTRQSGVPLPEEVAAHLVEWTTGYQRVRVQTALILTPDDPAALAPIQELATAAGWSIVTIDQGSLILRRSADAGPTDEHDLIEALRARGYAPLVSAVRP